jgi:lysozyme family protein
MGRLNKQTLRNRKITRMKKSILEITNNKKKSKNVAKQTDIPNEIMNYVYPI